jgi:prophage antirepressor-like protein
MIRFNELFADLKLVTYVDINTNIFFIANDVALALKFENPELAILENCTKTFTVNDYINSYTNNPQFVNPDIKKLHPDTILIPESDVYELTLDSKSIEAEKFQYWIRKTLIPSLKNSGSYIHPEQNTPNMQFDVNRSGMVN